jgi:hypothetical protein
MILSSHGIIGSSIVQSTLLLDTYPNAAAAYSLRLLTTAYTSSAIRVRRSVGSPSEIDIGFLGEDLDVAALESFCSGTDGFVTTWYDQSGNARNATQITAINQPQIVSSGSVILENGKPSLRFFNSRLDQLYNTGSWTYQTAFTLTRFITRPSFARIIGQLNADAGLITDVTGNGYRLFAGVNLYVGVNPSLTNQDLIYGLFDGSSSEIAVDGISATNGNAGSNVGNGVIISGTIPFSSSGTYLDANVQEIILYNSDESSNRTGIETNINDFYSIY